MINELLSMLITMNVTHVHLTFDDGPSPAYTKQVLKILKDNDMKANFFLVGEKVNENPEIVREIVKEGHDIGGHSMTHKQLTKIPFALAKSEILDSMALVNKFQKTKLFRFPYGAFNPELVKVLKDNGYRNIFWNVDTLDWEYKNKEKIYAKFKVKMSMCNDGAVVLMHDIHPQTVESLKMIVKYLKENHITVSKLEQ